MSEVPAHPSQPDERLNFLDELVGSFGEVAGDVLQVGPCTWAIHGSIPVDGDVRFAEYSSREAAADALAHLRRSQGF